MSKLRKSLDKASFRFEDVDVCLDGEAGTERDLLYTEMGKIDAAKVDDIAALQAKIDEFEDRQREALVTLRFRALATDKWNGICAKRGPREGVGLDQRKGYNIVAVTKDTAEASGWVVDGDKTESIPADEWADLWENLSGGDFDRIWTAVTKLNESSGWAGVAYLKKGSTKTPDSTGMSDSPATSE